MLINVCTLARGVWSCWSMDVAGFLMLHLSWNVWQAAARNEIGSADGIPHIQGEGFSHFGDQCYEPCVLWGCIQAMQEKNMLGLGFVSTRSVSLWVPRWSVDLLQLQVISLVRWEPGRNLCTYKQSSAQKELQHCCYWCIQGSRLLRVLKLAWEEGPSFASLC